MLHLASRSALRASRTLVARVRPAVVAAQAPVPGPGRSPDVASPRYLSTSLSVREAAAANAGSEGQGYSVEDTEAAEEEAESEHEEDAGAAHEAASAEGGEREDGVLDASLKSKLEALQQFKQHFRSARAEAAGVSANEDERAVLDADGTPLEWHTLKFDDGTTLDVDVPAGVDLNARAEYLDRVEDIVTGKGEGITLEDVAYAFTHDSYDLSSSARHAATFGPWEAAFADLATSEEGRKTISGILDALRADMKEGNIAESLHPATKVCIDWVEQTTKDHENDSAAQPEELQERALDSQESGGLFILGGILAGGYLLGQAVKRTAHRGHEPVPVSTSH